MGGDVFPREKGRELTVRERTRFLLLCSLTAILAIVVPMAAIAQEECGECDEDDDPEFGLLHAFVGGPQFQCDGPGSAGCHEEWWYDGACSQYHDPGWPTCFPQDEVVAAADALAESSVEAVSAIISRRPEAFVVDLKAGTVDILGCNGASVMSVGVSADVARGVAAIQSVMGIR